MGRKQAETSENATTTPRRFGRPPGVKSEDTRRRLLDAAKVVFANHGYKEASNKIIAAAAMMTPGAIYHYYANKQALFLAIHGELQEIQLDSLEPLIERATTLRGALRDILTATVIGRTNDPHSAAFLSVVRMEARRNPEISAALDDHRWLTMFERLTALGVQTGEVAPEHARNMGAVLSVFLLGIAQHAAEAAASGDRSAIDGLYKLIQGKLFKS